MRKIFLDKDDGSSYLDISTNTEIVPKLNHHNTFRFPDFALKNLQDGKTQYKQIPK